MSTDQPTCRGGCGEAASPGWFKRDHRQQFETHIIKAMGAYVGADEATRSWTGRLALKALVEERTGYTITCHGFD